MKIIEPNYNILDDINGEEILKKIEKIGRVCYKSESNITSESSKRFISTIIKRGHESVIEHEKVTVEITCDRGVSHEIVRHRIASYSQESTRYCNYSHDKFSNELTFIRPYYFVGNSKEYLKWRLNMKSTECLYLDMIKAGFIPEEARCILPNSLKTEIVVTMNLREWRHFFQLRSAKAAHPQMRQIVIPMLEEFKEKIPIIFDDIKGERV